MRNFLSKIELFYYSLPFVLIRYGPLHGHQEILYPILIYKNRLNVIREINALMGIRYTGHIDGLPMILLQRRKVAAYRPASDYFLVS